MLYSVRRSSSHGERYINSSVLMLTMASLFLLCACDSPTSARRQSLSNISADFHVSHFGDGVIQYDARLIEGPLLVGDDLSFFGGGFELVGRDVAAGRFSSENIFDELHQIDLHTVFLLHEQRFVYNDAIDGFWYSGRSTEMGKDAEYRIELLRNGAPDVLNSRVRLPPDFDITTPLDGQEFSRSNDSIVLVWAPIVSNTAVNVTAYISCLNGVISKWNSGDESLLDDPGTLVIPADALSGHEFNCKVSLVVERQTLGTLATEFGRGGQIIGHQYRSVILDTQP